MKTYVYNLSRHPITDQPVIEPVASGFKLSHSNDDVQPEKEPNHDFSAAFPPGFTIGIDDRLIIDGKPFIGMRSQADNHDRGKIFSIVRESEIILKEKKLFTAGLADARVNTVGPAVPTARIFLFKIGKTFMGNVKTTFVDDISHMPFAPSSDDIFCPFDNNDWYQGSHRWIDTAEPNVILCFAHEAFTAARQNGTGYMQNPSEPEVQLFELVLSDIPGTGIKMRGNINHLGITPGRADIFRPFTDDRIFLGNGRQWSCHYPNVIKCLASRTHIQDALAAPLKKVDPTGGRR